VSATSFSGTTTTRCSGTKTVLQVSGVGIGHGADVKRLVADLTVDPAGDAAASHPDARTSSRQCAPAARRSTHRRPIG
jgi:hypothetical protein